MSFFTKTDDTKSAPQAPARGVTTPRYHVKETTDAFLVTAHVPGVERTAIETQVDGETLSVTARRTWTAPENWTAVHREIPATDYRLVLELDHRFNREGVSAELAQGVLTLTLPKSEATKPRKIEIKG